jgi:hypothetical protein
MSKVNRREAFIEKARKVHAGENLDYSKVVYVNNHTPVEIIDHDLRPDGTEYGSFWQTPSNHLKGQCHPDKRGKRISASKKSKQEEIISRFKQVHKGENLDYSQVQYVNMHTKVKIISHDLRPDGTEYGEFWQEPAVHLKGCTHPEIKTKGRPKSNIIERPVPPAVGSFINTLAESGVGLERTSDYGSVFNLVSNERKIGLKFVGLHHSSGKWSLLNAVTKNESGYTPIVIFEDEYIQRSEIVKDKIWNILGLNGNKPRVYARKCVIDRIGDKAVVSDFINKYHIQGYSSSSLAYGAYYNGALIAVMTFIKESDCWNLNRFCTDIRYCCPGVASRLFKRFVKDIRPQRVKSFLDRRWCFNDETNLYTKLGFKLVKTLSPDYRYTNGHGERCHKFGFRKNSLHKKYGLPLWMTEREMTEFLGYYKIWDCGLYRYEWTS